MTMRDALRQRLHIPDGRLTDINALLLDPDSRVVNDLLDVVARYGTPEEINRQAEAARNLDQIMLRLAEHNCQYLDDIEWLIAQRDAGAFISEADLPAQSAGLEGRRHDDSRTTSPSPSKSAGRNTSPG